jgi:SAM-dependent methyltransferase
MADSFNGLTADAGVPAPVRMRELLLGFVTSMALYTVAELDIATALLDGPKSVQELADIAGADADVLGRILRLVASVGVFQMKGDVVEINDLGATLADGTGGSIRHTARYWMETHYAPFSDLLHTARTGQTAAEHHLGEPFFDWIAASPRLSGIQNAGMASVTSIARDVMLDGYQLPGDGTVADLGGNDGSVLCELLAKQPGRRGVVLDLANVVQGAHAQVAAAGLSDDVQVVEGDFFQSVPTADVFLLSAVLHDWDDESSLRILRNIADAASPGARLVLIDLVIADENDGARDDKALDRFNRHHSREVDVIMTAMLGGRERTANDWKNLLGSAGFITDRIVPSPGLFSIIETTRK